MTWIKELRGHSNRMLAKRHACWTTSPRGRSRSSLVLHRSSLLWIPGSDWKVSRNEPLATGVRLIYPRKDQQIGAGYGCPGFFCKSPLCKHIFSIINHPHNQTGSCTKSHENQLILQCFLPIPFVYKRLSPNTEPQISNIEEFRETFLTDMKQHPQENNALISHYGFYQFKHLILIIFYLLIYL